MDVSDPAQQSATFEAQCGALETLCMQALRNNGSAQAPQKRAPRIGWCRIQRQQLFPTRRARARAAEITRSVIRCIIQSNGAIPYDRRANKMIQKQAEISATTSSEVGPCGDPSVPLPD